ncbi:MAG: GNAT family N-acetyltransferase [Candidatus Velthaea sp.]
MHVELFGVGDPRIGAAIRLRIAVFVDEQRVPLAEEIDEHDRTDTEAVHGLVRAGGVAVATGRFFMRAPDAVQIGRMAVAAAARGTGIGRAVLLALMNEARRRGFATAWLDAQDHAVGFYAKAGFVAAGPAFVDAGIVHRAMRRALVP